MKIKKRSNALRIPPLPKAIKLKRASGDAGEESTVKKALEDVKRVFEKKNIVELNEETTPNAELKKVTRRRKPRRIPRSIASTKGIVYIGHIPHGFYEEQMEDYFKQFGRVTRVRVVRSRKTGKSRGYGYVEFAHPEVAKIAAETMNNYLMCGRLLKAVYIPPDEQHFGFFSGQPWSEKRYPKLAHRIRITRKRNCRITKKQHEEFVRKTKCKLSNLERKLKQKGIDLNFDSIIATEN